MKSKAKPKRYSNAAQIEKEIDDIKDQMVSDLMRIEKFEKQAKEARAYCAEHCETIEDDEQRAVFHQQFNAGNEAAKEVGRMERRRQVNTTRLLLLKRTLAVMRTDIMPFMDDRSVVAR